MSILQFPTQLKPPSCDTEVLVAALEIVMRFIDEGGDEEGDSDTEAFVRALREEIRTSRAIREKLQLRFNFGPDRVA